ncbi:YheC/YheD family endospore coat-associated protein [Thermoactinomyces mirandus]|uniref:YheC/YheD family protein n=1 Tax=Thermoactinomyces mirandus TaxID=2756294 RepID=A0A7W1XT49_9BACL|nr:YheC/YheD family protein [Thermoactinomyces mirandus]MBA4602802.1 YheC/YheD family protein [Thermoactinomyces mirandus]
MNIPKTGWLSIGPKRQPLEFVPLKRYQRNFFPGMVPAIIGHNTRAKIRFNPSVKYDKALYAPARIKHLSRKTYKVGPFIAILTSDNKKPFGGNQQNFADLIRTGRSMGVTVYVLTPQGMDNGTTVTGYLLDHHSPRLRWRTAKLPFPNVVYNRVPNRMVEKSPEVQQAIRRIQQTPGVYLFNPGFFDKWTLFRQLSQSPSLSGFLPETVKLHSPMQLAQMISRHPVLYLKPIEGKAGIRIMRLVKQRKNYELSFQTKSRKRRFQIRTLKEVWLLFNRLKLKSDYILQQGIPLAKYHGNPFDIRILLQKNIHGQWKLTGMGIRIAGSEAISTHVPMGGRIEKFDTVLDKVFGKEKNRIKKKIENIGIGTAQFIEAQQQSLLGEMSMDLGIESDGTLWIFEANSKPMKFDEPEIRKRSLQRIIEYSLYLSGFSHQSEGTAT